MTVIQTEMIETVRRQAWLDDNISVLLMYGSFIKGEADQYSDIEFYLFYTRDFDHEAWVGQIRPLRFFFVNEFGTEVAVFDNMIRGEFHFSHLDDIEVVKSWEGLTSFEYADQMSLVDKDGRLAEVLADIDKERPRHNSPENIDWLAKSLLNNLIMVDNILRRGDYAHAQQGFQYIQKYLLWLLRLVGEADKHWENPTKNLSGEISEKWYEAYVGCVPDLKPENLAQAFRASLALADEVFALLSVKDENISVLNILKKAGAIF